MTGIGTQGTSTIPVLGAGAQVIGQGTHGSAGSSTGAGAAGASTGLQGAGVGPFHGPSSGRDTSRYEEQLKVAYAFIAL